MQLERTKNGLLYSWDLVSSEGAAFILYPTPSHSQAEINAAEREIRHTQDVVRIHVANEDDRDYLYKTYIFEQPETKPLKWYEIEQDPEILRRERVKGTTPEAYVKNIVLPNVDATREKYIRRYGNYILSE